jgi:hypothetical protein
VDLDGDVDRNDVIEELVLCSLREALRVGDCIKADAVLIESSSSNVTL